MYYYDVYNNYDSRVDKENVGVCSPKGDHNNAAWDTEVILVPICIKASKEVKEKEKVCVWGGPKHAYTFCCSIHACFDTAKVTVMGREGIFKTSLLFPFCLCNKHACGLYLLFECHLATHLLLHSLQYIPWGLVDALCLITLSSFLHTR